MLADDLSYLSQTLETCRVSFLLVLYCLEKLCSRLDASKTLSRLLEKVRELHFLQVSRLIHDLFHVHRGCQGSATIREQIFLERYQGGHALQPSRVVLCGG